MGAEPVAKQQGEPFVGRADDARVEVDVAVGVVAAGPDPLANRSGSSTEPAARGRARTAALETHRGSGASSTAAARSRSSTLACRSITFLAAIPGIAVLPMCSTRRRHRPRSRAPKRSGLGPSRPVGVVVVDDDASRCHQATMPASGGLGGLRSPHDRARRTQRCHAGLRHCRPRRSADRVRARLVVRPLVLRAAVRALRGGTRSRHSTCAATATAACPNRRTEPTRSMRSPTTCSRSRRGRVRPPRRRRPQPRRRHRAGVRGPPGRGVGRGDGRPGADRERGDQGVPRAGRRRDRGRRRRVVARDRS